MESVRRVGLVLLVASLLAFARPAAAQESSDGGVVGEDLSASAVPIACGGDLCDTTNSSALSCDMAKGRASRSPGPAISLLLVLGLLALRGASRRRSRRGRAAKWIAGAGVAGALMMVHAAVAEPLPLVDVRIHKPAPPQRYVTIAWNPLPLILGKLSFDVIVTPKEHHALIFSPSYFWTHTDTFYIYDDEQNPTQLPRQYFQGGGGEISYRYYFGRGGPRGWFVGPSLLLASITATAMNGRHVSYVNYGGAVDGGYQILIANRVSISMGIGLQYTANNQPIPRQQTPALFLVNGGVLPRFLISVGWAF